MTHRGPSRRPRALLVYPEFPQTYWSFKHALPFAGKRSAFPPLGLLTLSSMLPGTWERRLVDMNVRRLADADLDWADVVFASAMIVQRDSLRSVIERCKARGRRVVVGGPFASTGAEHVAAADHVFSGEVETTFPEFLRNLEEGRARHTYQSAERPDLTLTPVPDFRLAEMRRYSSMLIQYSRGCPFNCEFCDIIEIYGRVPRTKSNEQMLAELDALYDAGWRGRVFIVDDNFIGNKRNVRRLLPALCEWMERRRYPFNLFTEASINLADDDELLAQMRRANFNKIFVGIETPVAESLKEAQKGQNTRRDLLDSVRKLQHYGMEVMAGFIVGFDNDPADIFQRQIDFIRQSAIPMAMVGLLTALPDTQLWRRLQREGRLLFESTGDNTDCTMNFVPRMDARELVEGYKTILRSIYSPVEYYARALDSLKRLNTEGVPANRASTIYDFASLARVVLKLGILDGRRREFWDFVARAFVERRELFVEAMTLAAMGYHFRKITEQYCGR
ncbi:MAG TPA: B12-binding domain-containing radical SAM protein [Pyrinomonadaceae bacterium]|nr:B12-binding domain-containing radical SAM protein [Pyrinomonadaceae bacterium]